MRLQTDGKPVLLDSVGPGAIVQVWGFLGVAQLAIALGRLEGRGSGLVFLERAPEGEMTPFQYRIGDSEREVILHLSDAVLRPDLPSQCHASHAVGELTICGDMAYLIVAGQRQSIYSVNLHTGQYAHAPSDEPSATFGAWEIGFERSSGFEKIYGWPAGERTG